MNLLTNNDNGNEGKGNKPPIWFVDHEAQRLVAKYKNPKGWLLYCKAINYIDQSRLHELEAKASTGRLPGHLFTVLLSQELERLNAGSNNSYRRIDKFRERYGEF